MYLLSSLADITHSFSFCLTLSSPEAGCLVKSIFESCWVIVLAPPDCPLPEMTPKTALNSALTSMPECSLNRMSSVARSALTKFCGISSFLAEVRFSKKYFPKTTLSAEMISVAKLFLGFSN